MGRTKDDKQASTSKFRQLFLQPVQPVQDSTVFSEVVGNTGATYECSVSPLVRDGNFYTVVVPGGAISGKYAHPVCFKKGVVSPSVSSADGGATYMYAMPNSYVQWDSTNNRPYCMTRNNTANTFHCLIDVASAAGMQTSVRSATCVAFAYNETLGHSVVASFATDANTAIAYATGSAAQAHTNATHQTLPGMVSAFATTPTRTLAFCTNTADSAGGVLKSSDGITWTASTPIPSTWGAGVQVRYGETVGGILWLYTNYGLLKSTDNGDTWTRAHSDPYVQRVCDAGADGLFTYGGTLQKSVDGGATWVKVTDIPAYHNASVLRSEAAAYGSLYYDPDRKLFIGGYGASVYPACFGMRLDGTLAFSYSWGELLPNSNYNGTDISQVRTAVVYASASGIFVMGSHNTAPLTGFITLPIGLFYANGESTYQIMAVGGGGCGQDATTSTTNANGLKSEVYGVVSAAGGAKGTSAGTGFTGFRPGAKQKGTLDAGAPPSMPGGAGVPLLGVEVGSGGKTVSDSPSVVSGGSGALASIRAVLPEGYYAVMVGCGGRNTIGVGHVTMGCSGGVLVEEM